MRILLFGRNGQLGWELNRTLLTLGEMTVVDYPEVDFNQPQTLSELIRRIHPNVIINAVAYTNVDKAESEPEIAQRVNADAVGEIARTARELGSLLVHYSTDYVFDGRKGSSYVETDLPNPLNVYGKTKLEGEQQVQAAGGAHLIFRTSWVYSNRVGGFVNKVIEWAKTKNELRIVDDQIGSPTWSRTLAELTGQVLAQTWAIKESWDNVQSEVYHVAGAGAVSRYEWVKEILRLLGREDIIVVPAKTVDFPTPAVRPLFSALDVTRFTNGFCLSLPGWKISMTLTMTEDSAKKSDTHPQPVINELELGIRNYLQPYENNFNYQNMLQGHLDVSRFYPWVDQINQYQPVEGARVLSSGCGSGSDLYAFADRGAAAVTGIEVDFDLAELANLRMKQLKNPIQSMIVDYGGEILPVKDQAFDIVISLHVLEHTQNPRLYLSELFRVLDSYGVLFLDLPSRYYSYEQHTQIKYIHYFPVRLRNHILRNWIRILPERKGELKYKVSTLFDFNFLTPDQILKIVNQFPGIRILDSYLHSYSDVKILFPQRISNLLKNKFYNMTTYRLVLQKSS